MDFLIWLGIIVVAIAFFGIITYNSIVSKANQVANSEGSINVMLKKRFDLIPNLVETANAYMKHEREIFENISNARYAFTNAKSTSEMLNANSK